MLGRMRRLGVTWPFSLPPMPQESWWRPPNEDLCPPLAWPPIPIEMGWGSVLCVQINVFSVFFPISKFRLQTIFLARNFGFYGFLKNETWLREGIFSGHQCVRCEQCSSGYVKYHWLLVKSMATVHWNLAMADWWSPNFWLQCERNIKEF
jgi:hypothetical protein